MTDKVVDAANRTMTGAELKVQMTGLGLTPAWLADQLKVTTRTIIRWFDADAVPPRVVAEIERITVITNQEIERLIHDATYDGIIYTKRTNKKEGVQHLNTLPAPWHRALTYRALQHLRENGVDAGIAYAPH